MTATDPHHVVVDGTDVLLVHPDGTGPHAALVVLHEASGRNDDSARIARHLASLGYLAAVPDLFGTGFRPLCIARTVREAFLAPAGRFTSDRIESVRAWLADRDDVDGARIGVIGFCMGGGFAVVAAARSPFAAAAVNYGRVPADPELIAGSCPVVANYGAEDPWIPDGTAQRYEQLLTAQGVPVDVEVFEGVGHSFMNHEPAAMARLRIAFDGPTAERAWARIEGFLDRHLGAPPA
ncbi:MAG: dienelactone hydrolase family protein [Nitriliruptoraceae bacterium]|nr:dienelactone hydrolase family protein [Nitriliruptoraceae bacterium]